MAMKKAEMEAHRITYGTMMSRARSAEKRRDFAAVVEIASSSLAYVDGMMQYERRYEKAEFKSVEAIDLVLKYAPALFLTKSLDDLEELLKNQRRIEKNTSHPVAKELADARTLMSDARRLWNHLETEVGTKQSSLRRALGGNQSRWRTVAEMLSQMGVIDRVPDGGTHRLSLATQMTRRVRAKCPSCGVVAKGVKLRFLDQITCPKCKASVLFVLLEHGVDAERRG